MLVPCAVVVVVEDAAFDRVDAFLLLVIYSESLLLCQGSGQVVVQDSMDTLLDGPLQRACPALLQTIQRLLQEKRI